MIANIFKFAWRNILRNKRRTLFTLSAVVFGLIAVVFARSFINGIAGSTGDALIKMQAGHIRLVEKEYLRLERILPREHLVKNTNELRKHIHQLPGVTSVREEVKFNVLLSNNDVNEPVLAIGIEPGEADKSLELSKLMVKGTYFGDSVGVDGKKGLSLIIGNRLAKKLKVTVGDELLLVTTDVNYSTYALPFRVAGLFQTGYANIDKHMLYIPLAKAREMLDCADSAHEVLVYLEDKNTAPAGAETLRNAIAAGKKDIDTAVIPWQENEIIEGLLPIIAQVWGKILGLIMFIVALVILNTMLMSVMERYHEIGVMKAMGLKNGEIFSMVMVEAFYIGIIGSAIGGIFGSGLALWLEHTGIDIAKMMAKDVWDKFEMPVPVIGRVMYPDFTVEILVQAIIFGVIMALCAVLYPALKSMKMKPVEAFRSKLNV
ncbi:MAG: ABC transporter permease [bacterium]|nr:ABC transporter permease [bacterium]